MKNKIFVKKSRNSFPFIFLYILRTLFQFTFSSSSSSRKKHTIKKHEPKHMDRKQCKIYIQIQCIIKQMSVRLLKKYFFCFFFRWLVHYIRSHTKIMCIHFKNGKQHHLYHDNENLSDFTVLVVICISIRYNNKYINIR